MMAGMMGGHEISRGSQREPASFRRLCAVQRSAHSDRTLLSPRRRNCRKPLACLIWPMTGSTTVCATCIDFGSQPA